jgi:hypothetical protein
MSASDTAYGNVTGRTTGNSAAYSSPGAVREYPPGTVAGPFRRARGHMDPAAHR